ncbi:hypothetical protein [Sphingomonas sp. PWP1-2]|uniref:hypothetical protein n=1 Tax=Sphingomonas sp. PWP1-2 TaxID=2804558 RepID=UPI003CF79EEB
MPDFSATPLLTSEHILGWISEHSQLKKEISDRLSRAKEIEGKIEALPRILPRETVSALIGNWTPVGAIETASRFRPSVSELRREPTIINIVGDLMAEQTGGRSVAWIREQIQNNPDTAHRLPPGSASLTTALGRMRDRGLLVRGAGDLHYDPSLYDKILNGAEKDELVEASPTRGRLAIGLREIMGDLGSAVAGEIIERAKQRQELVELQSDLTAAVYRWLSRESKKGTIYKRGHQYSLEPFTNASAQDGSPSLELEQKGAPM